MTVNAENDIEASSSGRDCLGADSGLIVTCRQLPSYKHVLLAWQVPEQHCADAVHAAPLDRQVAAWAALGATIDVTTGTATTAASPMARTIWRRFKPENDAGGVTWRASKLLSAN